LQAGQTQTVLERGIDRSTEVLSIRRRGGRREAHDQLALDRRSAVDPAYMRINLASLSKSA
jgi:hypothetical protein